MGNKLIKEYPQVWDFINKLPINGKNEEDEKEDLLEVFINNKITDGRIINFLTEETLKHMDIEIGLRILIIKAIKEKRDEEKLDREYNNLENWELELERIEESEKVNYLLREIEKIGKSEKEGETSDLNERFQRIDKMNKKITELKEKENISNNSEKEEITKKKEPKSQENRHEENIGKEDKFENSDEKNKKSIEGVFEIIEEGNIVTNNSHSFSFSENKNVIEEQQVFVSSNDDKVENNSSDFYGEEEDSLDEDLDNLGDNAVKKMEFLNKQLDNIVYEIENPNYDLYYQYLICKHDKINKKIEKIKLQQNK